MRGQVSWYRRTKEIIREEGWIRFIEKVKKYISIPIRINFDKFMTKVFAPFYISLFHKVYYYSKVWKKTYWLGIPVQKCPLDLWIYQEIIWETKPDFVIETGTAWGGSALFFASIFDIIGSGKIITIDIKKYNNTLSHPRIIQIVGDSTSYEVVRKVENIVNGGRAMVVLDSDHRKEHVLKELKLYSKFVAKGCYLVVEDTNLNGYPIRPDFGPGPMEAVQEFLRENNKFIIDREREKFFITFSPKGFLRRV